jgi:hypothetical protein
MTDGGRRGDLKYRSAARHRAAKPRKCLAGSYALVANCRRLRDFCDELATRTHELADKVI